ncbi:MAG: exodeoxyribonuclease VII large subunit [Planctomycetia bacterium]|nr:exodeoxyribonuclease VII large subunit [Planctomycetia bacterium]
MPPTGDTHVYSVSELTRSIQRLLEDAHPSIWVEGEVSNLARPASGHVYLTLKDEEAPLRAVMYRGVALRQRFDLRDGLRVVARGRLSVYVPRGDYQLTIEEVQPKGIGPLELAFRQLKEKLSVLGFFESSRKRSLPPFPCRVGLVSSATGSAVRDVLEVLARRWPALEVWLAPCRVQGEVAAVEIAGAIGLLNQAARRVPIDVIILARGGGSLEDLWPFNEELVGHEDDLTIADLVADRRALTPTEAAERVAPDRLEVARALDETAARLRVLLRRNLESARERLEALLARPCLRRPGERIDELRRRIDELASRLERAVKTRLVVAQQAIAAAAGRLDGLSPLRVLARGYSLTQREDGRIIRTSQDVRTGERITTRLASGIVTSVVEGTT